MATSNKAGNELQLGRRVITEDLTCVNSVANLPDFGLNTKPFVPNR